MRGLQLNNAPHSDARGTNVPRMGSDARAGGRERYVHAPQRVSLVSARRTCLQTPVFIWFQANGLV